LLLFWLQKVHTLGLLLGETEMHISCREKSLGIGAVEDNMLLILDIAHQRHTDHKWGSYFDSMSLFPSVGCEHDA